MYIDLGLRHRLQEHKYVSHFDEREAHDGRWRNQYTGLQKAFALP
jgi:hypothetical protein